MLSCKDNNNGHNFTLDKDTDLVLSGHIDHIERVLALTAFYEGNDHGQDRFEWFYFVSFQMGFKTHASRFQMVTAKLLYFGNNTITQLIILQQPSVIAMLNYHIIRGQPSQTNTTQYRHFLTLGSHQTVVSLLPLVSLSVVTMFPETKLVLEGQTGDHEEYLVIPITGPLRIDEKEEAKWNGIVGGRHINEIEKKLSSFLYLRYRTQNKRKDGEIVLLNEQYQKIVAGLSAKRVSLQPNQNLEVNKRILICLLKGKLRVESTKQEIQDGTCLYTSKGCGSLSVIEQSEAILFQFSPEAKIEQ